jgi:hypothetical protein
MTRAQSLSWSAAIILHSVPDLRCLLNLLDDAGQSRLAREIRKQLANPTVRIEGQPRPDPDAWLSGKIR